MLLFVAISVLAYFKLNASEKMPKGTTHVITNRNIETGRKVK